MSAPPAALREIYPKMGHADPDWMELREFYCPLSGALLEVEGVRALHCLHVWTIGSGDVSLSSHLVVAPGPSPEALLEPREPTAHDVGRDPEHATGRRHAAA